MKIRNRFVKALLYTMLTVVGLVFIFPIYYTFINSLRDIYSTPAIWTPKGFHWENFKMAVTLVPFFRYLRNSLIIVGISVSIGLVTNFLYGYALARFNVPGKNFIFTLVLSTMMIPSFATQIPQYVMFSKMGLNDTFWIWVLEALAGSSYLIFLCRQYLLSLPSSLVEAAMIDGASQAQIIAKIVVPSSKPVLAICFFQIFNTSWGDYMLPYMYLSKEKYPLIVALMNSFEYVLPGTSVRLVPVVNAATLLVAIPIFLVFFFCQKPLLQGATYSGVKG